MVKSVMQELNEWGKKKKGKKDSPLGIGFGLSSQKGETQLDSKRSFGVTLQKKTYDNQNGKCYKCHKPIKMSHMEFHHLKAWSKGGKTVSKNCVGLCHDCHKDIHDDARIKESDKGNRAKTEKSKPLVDLNWSKW
jgi:5-methylcytosine-specific restriction endonuclease McrA